MNEKRLSIRFYMDDEADLMIWNYLMEQPKGSRQNTIKIAMLHEIRGSDEKADLKKFIQDTIKNCLKDVSVTQENTEHNEIPSDVLSFISAL